MDLSTFFSHNTAQLLDPYWERSAPLLLRLSPGISSLLRAPRAFLGGFAVGLFASPLLDAGLQYFPEGQAALQPAITVLGDSEARMPDQTLLAHSVAASILPWIPQIGPGVAAMVGFWVGIQVRHLVVENG